MRLDFESYLGSIKNPSHKSYRRGKTQKKDSTVLEIWKDDRTSIDEIESYEVDNEIKVVDRGLFDSKISGKELIEMKTGTKGRKLTLLQRARTIFLDTMVQKGRAPTREEMSSSLTPDFDKLVQIALQIRQNKKMEISLDLEEVWVVGAIEDLCDNIPVHLKNWIEVTELRSHCSDILERFRAGEYESKRDALVSKLKGLMTTIASEGRLKILNGRPGTGKSTTAGEMAQRYKTPAIIALSNTICNMFVKKCPKIERYSCTKARYSFKHHKHDCIVFDESSQFGYETLDLLIDIFENNPSAMFIFMGDLDQIPTFLSSGSFLYSAIEEFPDCTTVLSKQHRYENNPSYRDLMSAVVKSEVPDGVQIDSFTPELVLNTDCFITGANDTVNWLNKVCLKVRNPELVVGDYVDKPDIAYALCTSKNPTSIPLIANSTKKLKSRGEDYKLYVNTRFSFSHMSDNRFVLKNQVDGTTVIVSDRQLNSFFSLAYAITVNKSQGLEWSRVCVYVTPKDRNLKNFNAMYVAISRGMDVMILATDENKSFTKEDLINILHKRYKFKSFFRNV